MCDHNCYVILLPTSIPLSCLPCANRKWRIVILIFALGVCKLAYARCLLCRTGFCKTGHHVIVVNIVKQPITAHNNDVFFLQLVFSVECFGRWVAIRAALIREIKPVLLLFWPEYFDKRLVLSSPNDVAGITQVCSLHNSFLCYFSETSSARTCKFIHGHCLAQNLLQWHRFVSFI